MQLHITEAYAREAVKGAVIQPMADGAFVARVPGLPGVIAFGSSERDALIELYTVAQDWARLGAKMGHYVPPLGDIDLNTPENRKIAGYE